MKEVLLYSSIYSYTVERFIERMEEYKDSDVIIRINTYGGSPEDGWGLVAKISEHKKAIKIKVDGKAFSMGAFALCYTSDVEALDVTSFLIHRAAYPNYIERDSAIMTEERWADLKRINDHLRAALEGKIDVKKFEKLKGVTLDQVFSTDSRIDVMLTAKEALSIGLISKITTITPEKRAEIESLAYRIAAESAGIEAPEQIIPDSKIPHKMTIEELQAKYPDLYAAVHKAGATAERDRVGAWMAFNALDPERVAKAIKEGETFTQTAMAEFAAKAMSAKGLEAVAADSPKPVETDTPEPPKTQAEAATEDFFKTVRGNLGMK